MGISLSTARSHPLAGAVIGLVIAAALFAFAYASSSQAGETVLVRGVVKPGGGSDSVNLYITHVASAPDASAIRGIRTDVDLGSATKYVWEVQNGALTKVKTGSNPAPEKEVVVRGTLLDDNRITASWMVQNYREFTIEGTLQGRTIDTGKTDEGYLTVNVSESIFRNVTPDKPFKEDRLEGKDWLFRVNGTTTLTSLGSSKELSEVVPDNQNVRIEGQMNDEDVWVISKFNELN